MIEERTIDAEWNKREPPSATPKLTIADSPRTTADRMMSDTDHTLTDDDAYALVDLLAADFLARSRNGERPTIDEYAQRHPDLAELIERVFPLVVSVEKVKVDRQCESDGGATLAGRQIDTLGDFRLLRELGRGGMGIVYAARQESLGRDVAIKILPKQSLLDDEALDRFRREARTAAGLHHSGIVPVFGTGESDSTHYLVLQLVHGRSLDLFCEEQDSQIPIRTAAEIGRQLADALAYAHERGVLHRDVKPANVLIDEAGNARLTDFGLARNRNDDPTMTQALSGSPRYMAPERFRGEADQRADIYGVGVTLYEVLAGRPAFEESAPHQLVEAVGRHHVPPLTSLRDDVPIDLRTVVEKAMHPEASRRYQTAAELRDDLQRFLDDRPVRARRTSRLAHGLRWCRRNPKLATASVATVVSLFTATIASTVGLVLVSDANERTTAALIRSEETMDVALDSLDGVAEAVSGVLQPFTGAEYDEFDASGIRLHASPSAARVLSRLLPIYERLANQSPTRPDIVNQMFRARLRLSQIQSQLGRTQEAIATLKQGVDLLRSRGGSARLPASEERLLLARLHNALGGAYATTLQYRKSDEAYTAAIDAASANDSNDALRLQLASAYVSLGDPPPQRVRDQKLNETHAKAARAQLNKASEILETLDEAEAFPTDVAVLRARVLFALSRSESAPDRRREMESTAATILRTQLERAPDDAHVQFALVELLASVNPRRLSDRPEKAERAASRLREALDELQPLRQANPDSLLFATSEVHILHKLTSLSRARGQTRDALDHLQRAIALQSRLVEAAPKDVARRCWRALLYRSLAETHREVDNIPAARDALTAAEADLDAIREELRSHPFYLEAQQATFRSKASM